MRYFYLGICSGQLLLHCSRSLFQTRLYRLHPWSRPAWSRSASQPEKVSPSPLFGDIEAANFKAIAASMVGIFTTCFFVLNVTQYF